METPSATNERISLDDLFTVPEFAAAHPSKLTVSLLRRQLRRRAANGLAHCCVLQGKRLLISKTRYEQWLASRAGAA